MSPSIEVLGLIDLAGELAHDGEVVQRVRELGM